LISASSRSSPWHNLSIGFPFWLTFVMAVPIVAAQTKAGLGSTGAAEKLPETERARYDRTFSRVAWTTCAGQTSLIIAPMLTIFIVLRDMR
jgi:hypothetical protein